MTPSPSLPTLPGLTWSRHKKPGFSTRVASHVSGREVRVALMSYPLYEFEAAYAGLASSSAASFANLGASSLQTLMGFFLQLLGQAGVFLYTDPDDNAAAGQSVGVGDGATRSFVMSRTLGGFSEPVSYVTAVNAVYLNGVSQGPAGVNWQFTAPNMLGFATAPGAGVVITADFTFAFQCRFFDDQLDFEEFMNALWKLDSLKFRSVKVNTSASGAVIPSWYSAYAIGSIVPYGFADFTTEGGSNHYLWSGTGYSSAAAWLTAAGGSYTNSSGKRVTSSSGLLASVAANALPFNHDGSGNPLGLLLEGASTNFCLHSSDFTQSMWTKASATVVSNSAVAPDGTTTADLVYPSSTGTDEGVYQNAIASAAGTSSVYAKAAGFNWVFMYDPANTSNGAWFNVSTGALGTVASGFTASITPAGNGWYRLSISSSGSATYVQIYVVDANGSHTATASGTNGVYLWGAQQEAGSASSYIPTTSSTASRAADSLYLPWTLATFTARLKATLAAQVNGATLADTGNGLLTEAAGPDVQTSNGTQSLTTGIAAFTQANIAVVGGSPSGRVISANGNAAASDSNALVPFAGANIYIGASSSGTNEANGNYAQIALHSVAATAAQAAAYSGTA